MKDGKGKQTWPNGSYYDGNWSNNLPEGQGVFKKPNGDTLSGNFHKGRAHGLATFQQVPEGLGRVGNCYTGMWQHGKKHGKGEEFWADGAKFEGYYKDNKKNGEGVLTLADGSTYKGTFRDGVIEGSGTYKWANGKVYEGQWLQNKMNGFGKLSWSEGETYIGQFKEDMFDGQGQYQWKDGKTYIGQWCQGKQHGEGKLFDGNKMKIGVWNMGDRKQEWLQEFDESSSQFDLESRFFENQSFLSLQNSKSLLRDNSPINNNNNTGSQLQQVATFSSNNTLVTKFGSFMTALDKNVQTTNTFITADDKSQI